MSTSNDFLLAGDLYLDRLTTDGLSTGWMSPCEVGKLEFEESADIKTRNSKMRDTYGQVKTSVALKKTAKFKLTLNEITPSILAMSLLGENVLISQSAGNVTSASPSVITLTPGKWIDLPHRFIKPHVAVTSPIVIETDEATPVIIPLSDVEINTRLGQILYTGSTLTDATQCNVTYYFDSYTSSKINGSVQPVVKLRVKLDGKNLVTGRDVIVTIDEATVSPKSPIDFMSDDWSEVQLEGEMTTVEGKTSPYTVEFM